MSGVCKMYPQASRCKQSRGEEDVSDFKQTAKKAKREKGHENVLERKAVKVLRFFVKKHIS